MSILDFQRDYYAFMLSDELHQFKGEDCVNTRAVLRAIAKQFDDLLEAFRELAEKRGVDGSEGVQLDGCGDIVRLTRAQAAMLSNEVTTDLASIDENVLAKVTTPMELLARHAQYGIIPFDVIDDDRYRQYIKFKIFLNTNTCTYADVMKVVRMFWTNSPVYYIEDVNINGTEYHATILLDAGTLRPEQNARLFSLVPIIKAAGVMLLRRATTRVEMKPETIRAKGAIYATSARTTIPQITITI